MRILLLALLTFPAAGVAKDLHQLRVRVFAGDHDRRESIVSFAFPDGAPASWVALAEDGSRQPVQLGRDGQASFILASLDAGKSATYVLQRILEPDTDVRWVEVLPEKGRLRLSVAGEPSLFYQAEERPLTKEGLNPLLERGGFLHPVVSPGGKIVSESYAEGHPHHQGIWAPWTKTVFEGRTPDFWNMGAGTGKVEFEKLEETWSGPVAGGFRSRHQFVDLTSGESIVALNETWTVNLYQVGAGEKGYRLFDLALYQELAGESPLELPEYRYGGLGFRGRDEWVGKQNTFFLTSEGETDREKGNFTRARWTHVGGEVDGDLTGIAILGHPENFRAPQPVRLHPSEPFFCFAPSQLGDWAITKEEPYRARYRFAVMDGAPDVDLIERLWNDFAYPVKVELEEAGP